MVSAWPEPPNVNSAGQSAGARYGVPATCAVDGSETATALARESGAFSQLLERAQLVSVAIQRSMASRGTGGVVQGGNCAVGLDRASRKQGPTGGVTGHRARNL